MFPTGSLNSPLNIGQNILKSKMTPVKIYPAKSFYRAEKDLEIVVASLSKYPA